MKLKTWSILALSLVLFCVLESFGHRLSIAKPLWRDELNTQSHTLSEPYLDILLGKDRFEGNVAPLFYLQQKIFCDLSGFKTPAPWLQYHWDYADASANIFLRILPVFWLSAFFVLLFLYFSLRFNIGFGILTVLIALSSPLLWLYWAEARPYGLWVLLTGLQMILFLEILRNNTRQKWAGISLVHILLSLTCTMSFFQIMMVSLMLLFKERRLTQYILPLGLPLLLIYFYRPPLSDDVIFLISVSQLMLTTIPVTQCVIIGLYFLCWRMYGFQEQKYLQTIFNSSEIKRAFPFFLSIALMYLSSLVFLIVLHTHNTSSGQYILNRHILFLIPVFAVGVGYLAALLWRNLSSLWLKIAALAIIALLLSYKLNLSLDKIHFLLKSSPYV